MLSGGGCGFGGRVIFSFFKFVCSIMMASYFFELQLVVTILSEFSKEVVACSSVSSWAKSSEVFLRYEIWKFILKLSAKLFEDILIFRTNSNWSKWSLKFKLKNESLCFIGTWSRNQNRIQLQKLISYKNLVIFCSD